jgi:hypothetical protein
MADTCTQIVAQTDADLYFNRCAARSEGSQYLGSTKVLTDSTAPSRMTPRLSAETAASAVAADEIKARACGSNVSAATVRAASLPGRLSMIRAPMTLSSESSVSDIVDCARPSSRAAELTLPWSLTATNTRQWRISRSWVICPLSSTAIPALPFGECAEGTSIERTVSDRRPLLANS